MSNSGRTKALAALEEIVADDNCDPVSRLRAAELLLGYCEPGTEADTKPSFAAEEKAKLARQADGEAKKFAAGQGE